MSGTKLLAENRKARHEYFLTEPLECGMILEGTEVKSMKGAQFSFNDAWIEIDNNGELWIRNLHINPYKQAGKDNNHDPDRRKKLLAQKKEIKRLRRQCDEKGFTLIPSDFHLKNGRIKVQICLAKGKKDYDKRATIKEKDVRRDTERELGRR